MALIIRGKTTCAICNQVITDGDEVVGFPAFVWNLKDPLLLFNDATVHARCLAGHPDREKVLSRVQDFYANAPAKGKNCRICSKPIASPTDHVSFPYLTDDPSDPLYQFNYAHFHKACWQRWPSRTVLQERLKALADSDKWKGDSLNVLLAILASLEESP